MSTLKTNTIKNTDDVEMYLAKAWVNFNASGTVAIRAAGNVSSITDNGVGLFTLNFTNALVDGSYVMAGSNGNNTGGTSTARSLHRYGEWTTTECAIRVATVNNSNTDDEYIGVTIHR